MPKYTPDAEKAAPAPVNGVDQESEAPMAAPAPVAAEKPAPRPETTPAAPREPTEVVITQSDPNAPKKGGWWSRMRTPFGG